MSLHTITRGGPVVDTDGGRRDERRWSDRRQGDVYRDRGGQGRRRRCRHRTAEGDCRP